MNTSIHDISIDTRRLTHAFWRARELSRALAMASDLQARNATEEVAIMESLADFALRDGSPYKRVIDAIRMLAGRPEAFVKEALVKALEHPLIKVRRAAVDALRGRQDLPWAHLTRLLTRDTSHHIRIGLIDLLAEAPDAHRWDIVLGCDDPHWRVRKQVLTVAQQRAKNEGIEETRAALLEELTRRGLDGDLSRGVIAYYDLYTRPETSIEDCQQDPVSLPLTPDLSTRPWWHEEPSLTRANLKAMERAEAKQEDVWLVWALAHPDDRVRSMIIATLASVITPDGVLSFLMMASDHRLPGIDETREKLLGRVNHDALERCAWTILESLHARKPLWEVVGIHEIQVDEVTLEAWALRWLARHIPSRVELESSERWSEAFRACTHASNPVRRRTAIDIATELGLTLPADALEGALSHPDLGVALAALDFLANNDSQLSKDTLLEAANNSSHTTDERYRAALARLLIRHGASAYEEEILSSGDDVSTITRVACAAALVEALEQGAELETNADALLASAQNNSPEVVAMAKSLLETVRANKLPESLHGLLARLQQDKSAKVREAALTKERAAWIIEDPRREASWRVLAAAAEICRQRLERLVPADWLVSIKNLEPARGVISTRPIKQAEAATDEELAADLPQNTSNSDSGEWWERVPLGNTSLEVSRMGISGHYALPERGFAEALERGINAYFWEPIYLSQSRFFKPLSKQVKSDLVMCCGTFEATAHGLRRDLERALEAMDLEQIQVFYVFWIRDRDRLTDELLLEMERIESEGLVHTFGVTTHSRSLAREFVQEWPAVMVRHNAAHTGIEREVLPYVDPAKAGLITFSNLCYGRMISELPGWDKGVPSAADAYRYSLSQPNVTGCWSAPSSIAQLRENLSALTRGPMDQDELEAMRAYGRELYRLNTGFNRFVRQA